MTFANRKKTFLDKLDKSKKGDIDEKLIPLIELINSKDNYFTTSSCSGRIFLWSGLGKKNETNRLNVSHNLIDESFFNLETTEELVWLRLEPFIFHVCCEDLNSAETLLDSAKQLYKKSSILSLSNKIIVEIRGSEFMELPLIQDGIYLFKESNLPFITQLLNQKLTLIHQKIDLFYQNIKEEK